MRLEQLDELGKIRQRSRQAVDLLNHHNINLAGPNVRQ